MFSSTHRQRASCCGGGVKTTDRSLVWLLWVEESDSEALNPTYVQPSPGYRENNNNNTGQHTHTHTLRALSLCDCVSDISPLHLIHLTTSQALHKHTLTDVGDPKIRCRPAVITEPRTINQPVSHAVWRSDWGDENSLQTLFLTVTTRNCVMKTHSLTHQIKLVCREDKRSEKAAEPSSSPQSVLWYWASTVRLSLIELSHELMTYDGHHECDKLITELGIIWKYLILVLKF